MFGGATRARTTITSLRPAGGPNRTNILLFGEPGSGKSSFAGTLVRSFDPSAEVPSVVPQGTKVGGSSHTRVSSFYNIAHTNIRVRDVWGWRSGEKNFEPIDLKIIMTGSVDNEVEEPKGGSPIAFKATNRDDEIDGVVFFLNNMDYSTQLSKFVAYWTELLPYVKVVQELKKPYIFVINKLDELEVIGSNGVPQSLVQRGVTTLSTLQINPNWTNITAAVIGAMGTGARPPLPLVCYLSTELRVAGPGFHRLEDVEEYALQVLLALLYDPDASYAIPTSCQCHMFKYERPHHFPITTVVGTPEPDFFG